MVPPEQLRRYLDAADVSDETICCVAEIAEERAFEAESMVFREDEASDHLYVVTSGQVDVQYP
jgi:CRP-like cAMP-binding protein